MRQISIARAAMAVGTVAAAWHLIWVLLVGVGWAKSFLDFVFALHFIHLTYALAPFSAFTGLSLIAIAFCAGALIGALFALAWNWLTFESAPQWERDTRGAQMLE